MVRCELRTRHPARVAELDEDRQRVEDRSRAVDALEIGVLVLAVGGGEVRRVLHEHAAHLARLDEWRERVDEQLEAAVDHALIRPAHSTGVRDLVVVLAQLGRERAFVDLVTRSSGRTP